MSTDKLGPDKAYIWRILHRDNLQWVLSNGLHSASSEVRDPNFIAIGNPELIGKRAQRDVPVSSAGTLNDYIPFYFTPFSPMMLNIVTGRGGVPRREQAEIVIVVTSLRTLSNEGIPFVFTDRHAYLSGARFSKDLADLAWIDWGLLGKRDFKRDPDDPGKMDRYQAEALVYRHLPVSAIKGLVCYSDSVMAHIQSIQAVTGTNVKVHVLPKYYF